VGKAVLRRANVFLMARLSGIPLKFKTAREKPNVIEISHHAVRDGKHHHGLKFFGHGGLTTIGSQARRWKLKNRGELNIFGRRSDGVAEAGVHLDMDAGPLQWAIRMIRTPP